MTTVEFSNEFDGLWSSFGGGLPLDEYEKSVYLTKAEEELVKGLYRGTILGVPLEDNEEIRRYLECLICTDNIKPSENKGINKDSQIFKLKNDVLYIIYEHAELTEGVFCKNDTTLKIVPARHDEWGVIKNNPFRGPNKRRIIRLDSGNNEVELISKYPISEYIVRYVRKPNPIILVNLDNLSINGKSTITECELNDSLHRTILETAVKLALSARASK